VQPTGRSGTPADLEPEVDLDVIGELVGSAAKHLKVEQV